MIVVVCPGQGSQTPGFLAPWVTEPRFRDHLEALSSSIDVDLLAHGTVSDAVTIRDTAVAQPLIVAAGLITLGALRAARPGSIHGIAGHSVGELTAASGAGILSEADAMHLVHERGQAMAAAAALEHTGMSAVIGADEDELLDRLTELGLEPANFNGSGQIVVAGSVSALAALRDDPPAKSRVIPLEVAGAFHTRYMAPAVERMRTMAARMVTADPTIPIWSNSDGGIVTSGTQFLDSLVSQVSSPVRWDLTMQSIADAGATGVIELAPAGALTGLIKRGIKGLPTVAVKSPADLPAAIALIDGDA